MSSIEKTEVGKLGPRLEALVNPNEKPDILCIIATHEPPGFGVALYTTSPQMGTSIRHFPPTSEIAAEIIKFVAIELERPASELEGIYRLERSWRLVPVNRWAGVDLLDIEGVTIMSNNNIGPV